MMGKRRMFLRIHICLLHVVTPEIRTSAFRPRRCLSMITV